MKTTLGGAHAAEKERGFGGELVLLEKKVREGNRRSRDSQGQSGEHAVPRGTNNHEHT